MNSSLFGDVKRHRGVSVIAPPGTTLEHEERVTCEGAIITILEVEKSLC